MDQKNPAVGLPSDPQWNESKCYRVKSGFMLREIAGEYLAIPVELASTDESCMAVLNEQGKFLWEQLMETKTLSQLIAAMTECYEVSEEEARADIIEFVNLLSDNQLLMKMEEKK